MGAIVCENLTRRFDSFTAVDAINLDVGDGKIFGLLGPNGAGKSTTIKMLTTLLPVTSGRASVAGYDCAELPRCVRRSIGYVPQAVSADGALTARENLRFSAKLYDLSSRARDERIREALDFMKLTDFADKLVKTFSGGMIRRLELAQAMIHRPRVLFLDEPSIGLDPVARQTVWDYLIDLNKKFDMTILITTHDMDEAEALCDELAIMHQGKIAAIGSPTELKAKVGEGSTLDDVFKFFSGTSITQGGAYRDVRRTRNTASRLG